jgi:hypothetical protein
MEIDLGQLIAQGFIDAAVYAAKMLWQVLQDNPWMLLLVPAVLLTRYLDSLPRLRPRRSR